MTTTRYHDYNTTYLCLNIIPGTDGADSSQRRSNDFVLGVDEELDEASTHSNIYHSLYLLIGAVTRRVGW